MRIEGQLHIGQHKNLRCKRAVGSCIPHPVRIGEFKGEIKPCAEAKHMAYASLKCCGTGLCVGPLLNLTPRKSKKSFHLLFKKILQGFPNTLSWGVGPVGEWR